MAANFVAVVLAIISMMILKLQNRRADGGSIVVEGLEGFRYTI